MKPDDQESSLSVMFITISFLIIFQIGYGIYTAKRAVKSNDGSQAIVAAAFFETITLLGVMLIIMNEIPFVGLVAIGAVSITLNLVFVPRRSSIG